MIPGDIIHPASFPTAKLPNKSIKKSYPTILCCIAFCYDYAFVAKVLPKGIFHFAEPSIFNGFGDFSSYSHSTTDVLFFGLTGLKSSDFSILFLSSPFILLSRRRSWSHLWSHGLFAYYYEN